MGLGQLALSGILGALAQPGLEPGEGPRAPTLQLPDRHADLPGDGLDRLTPQQAQHHLVLASQAPALAGRERTSPGGRPWDGRHGRAALALAAHKPSRIDHRLSITFHAVVLQFLGTIRCPEKPRAAQAILRTGRAHQIGKRVNAEEPDAAEARGGPSVVTRSGVTPVTALADRKNACAASMSRCSLN